MLNKIIYVVGAPRSGSSFIYNAISSNKIFNPGISENHLVPKLVEYCLHQITRNKKIEKNCIFDSEKDIKKYFNNYLEIFFNKVAKKYNVNHLILKSVAAAPNINFINMIYPNISYVMTIRDPRDIVVSMINIGKKQEKLKLSNQYPRNIKKLCDFINFTYRLIFKDDLIKFFNKSVFFIKYEDFVEQPSLILNNFAKKFSINIKYENNINFWERSLDPFLKNDDVLAIPYKSSLWNKPTSKDRLKVYKEILTQKEISEVKQYCQKIMNYFNY